MCGICGIFNYHRQESVDHSTLQSMTDSMVHRGPDDEGFHLEGPVGLGMRRLSIIDVSGGHQPIYNEDKSIAIVFNGEIYNFLELRSALEAKGHRFSTHTDTEVIVHGYEEWGDDVLLHLNGIFGFALWDRREQRLLLARDHFGVKPLYYYDDGQRLLWGSEVKAILMDKTVPRAVDAESLDLFLTFRFVPSPSTMFKDIHKLPPGHRLIQNRVATRIERYWHPRPEVNRHLCEQDYIELLQDRLEAAVRRQMISDVPVGALLSGGIDSAVIVALMAQLTDHPVRTFTIGFREGGGANELAEARMTAKRFHTEHYGVLLDRLEYQQLLQKMMWHLEEPISTSSALAMYAVCKVAREHVTVVLAGQGADEPMAGYHRYYGERYGHLYRGTPALFRNGIVRPLVEALPRQERIKRAVRSLGTTDIATRFTEIYAVFPPDLQRRMWRPEYRPLDSERRANHVVNYWRQGIDALEPVMQMGYVDARLSLSDDLLIYGDKMAMATSIEARVPFLDLPYMAAAEALPSALRIRGRTRKYIHKKVVAKWLPPEIIKRPKRGFETPIDSWFRSELAGYVREMLLASDSGCRIFFQPAAVERLLAEHLAGRQDHRRQLFSLLVFDVWYRQFVAGPVLEAV